MFEAPDSVLTVVHAQDDACWWIAWGVVPDTDWPTCAVWTLVGILWRPQPAEMRGETERLRWVVQQTARVVLLLALPVQTC